MENSSVTPSGDGVITTIKLIASTMVEGMPYRAKRMFIFLQETLPRDRMSTMRIITEIVDSLLAFNSTKSQKAL